MILSTEYIYDKDFAQKLASAFTRAGSDKASHHGYEEIYSHLLAHTKPRSFLEIGLFLGDTPSTDLHAWAEVFPDADIYGADIKGHLLFEQDRIKTFFIDQDKPETMTALKASIGKKVDIILDDASHIFELTVKTFETMFDLVADDGVYLIEDILFENYNMDSWEQRASQLVDYFDKTGLEYSIYATSKVHSCVDSVVLAVFK
jgi:hypothetical protein